VLIQVLATQTLKNGGPTALTAATAAAATAAMGRCKLRKASLALLLLLLLRSQLKLGVVSGEVA
jgi:hypothetical protein